MSEYPAVDFEVLAKKYATEKNDATFRADQLENIAGTLKAHLDQTTGLLDEERRKNTELKAQAQQRAENAANHDAATAVIPGETV